MTLLRACSSIIATARQNVVWLLLGVYALAALLPGAGNDLRSLPLGTLPFSAGIWNVTHLLLAALLLAVGVSIRPGDAGASDRPTAVLQGLAASWLVPVGVLAVVVAMAAGRVADPAAGAFMVGAILVVAMPAANSATAWSELSGGRPATTLWIIVLATLLSPLATPAVIAGFASAAALPGLNDSHAAGNLLEVLCAFVVLPAALGMVLRGLAESLGARVMTVTLEGSRAVALLSLLALNYVNGAAALPQLLSQHTSRAAMAVALLTLLLCAAVFGVAAALARALRSEPSSRAAFTCVVGMKNTGASLVIASTVLADQPLAILAPVIYTLAQHLAAALVSRFALASRGATASAAPERPREPGSHLRASSAVLKPLGD
jgi:BASS family bile acid:Na+ symporter